LISAPFVALFQVHLWERDGSFYPGSGRGSDDGGEGNDERASGVLNVAIPPLWKASGVHKLDEQVGGARSVLKRARHATRSRHTVTSRN